MQVFGPFLDGFANVHVQLWEHLRSRTMAALARSEAEKAGLERPQDVWARARAIREAFLESIGGLPGSEPPLNVQVRGRVRAKGFVVEKIIFESQPRTYVTAHLYLPGGLAKPAPAILFLSGHHREAKGNPEYQRVCHDLATNGFVVLAIDPTGQGERVTHFDPDTGAMAIEWGTTEHSFQGQQCILTGTSIARYFLFDALRALDVLQGRPEVDPGRIGVTGNSGGGTQTSLVCMSGDPRIKAAVPCTYVTSREHYYRTGQPQDAEQLQFGMTRDGINFDDFFIPFAPRPLLIGAVASDFFNPEGTELTYSRLRRIYRIFGQEDRVERVFAPGTHAYGRELRQAAVNWFRRHLMDREPDFVSAPDETIETRPDSELWCTSKGHVLSEFPDAHTPYHLNLKEIPRRPPRTDPREVREAVARSLGIADRLAAPVPFFPRTIRSQQLEEFAAGSVFFCSEPDIMVAGCLIHAGPPNRDRVTLVLAEGGPTQLERELDTVRDIIRTGADVFVLDVRGTGAVEAHPVNAYGDEFPLTFFNTEAWFAWSAYCLGECLPGMRVFDVMRAAECLRSEFGYAHVGLRAEGLQPALWGYLAAALDPAIDPVWISGLIESFENIVRTAQYPKTFTPAMLIPGVLREFDLPELRFLFTGRSLEVEKAR